VASKINTLRRSSDFLYIKENGKKIYSGRWILLNYIENQQKSHRFGWTISSKVGSAVLRNKFKRWCREFLKKETLTTDKNYDVNIILRVSRNVDFKKLSFDEFQKALQAGFRQIR